MVTLESLDTAWQAEASELSSAGERGELDNKLYIVKPWLKTTLFGRPLCYKDYFYLLPKVVFIPKFNFTAELSKSHDSLPGILLDLQTTISARMGKISVWPCKKK